TGMASGKLAVTLLVLLSGAGGAGIIAAELLSAAAKGLRLLGFLRRIRQRPFPAVVGSRIRSRFGMLILDIAQGFVLLCRAQLFRAADLHGHQDARDIGLDHVEQQGKQLEGLAFVLLRRVLLGITPKVYALAQVVQRRQVLTP